MRNEKGLIEIIIATIVVVVLIVGVVVAGSMWQSSEQQKMERQIKKLTLDLDDLKHKVTEPAEEVTKGVKEVAADAVSVIKSPRGSIKVTTPQPGDTIKSPVKIAGKASTFEGNVQLQVKDSTGKILGKGFATTTVAAPQWGDFKKDFKFDTPSKSQTGTVEIFTEDVATGEVDDLVTISVLLK
jgi:hypothetical protein